MTAPLPPVEVRLLQAAKDVEHWLAFDGVDVAWAIASAAKAFHVDRFALVLTLLTRHVECQRARAKLQALDQADVEAERRAPPAARPRRREQTP